MLKQTFIKLFRINFHSKLLFLEVKTQTSDTDQLWSLTTKFYLYSQIKLLLANDNDEFLSWTSLKYIIHQYSNNSS